MIFSRTLITLLIGITILGKPPTSQAKEQTCSFNIPVEALSQALKDFAEQCGYQILYKDDEIPQQNVGPFNGDLLASEVFLQIIENTNLDYSLGKNRSIAVFLKKKKKNDSTQINSIEQPAGRLEETYVTGLRNSLQASIDKKRNALSIQEHVNSEDIGRFPDRNIGDSLQRVPGVSVDRLWGEGRDVNIRGTSKDVNRTLLNGQHIASSYWWASDKPGRGFNYSLIPSKLIQSLAVTKTPSASQDEGSLGGTIDLKTYKPFELKSTQATLFTEYEYLDLSKKGEPQFSIVGNYLNPNKTLGILIVTSHEKRQIRRDGLETFFWESQYSLIDENNNTYENIDIPVSLVGSAYFQQERTRNSLSIVSQFLPSSNWKLEFNLLKSAVETDNKNENFLTHIWASLNTDNEYQVVTSPIFLYQEDTTALIGGTLGEGQILENQEYASVSHAIAIRDTYVKTDLLDIQSKQILGNLAIEAQIGQSWAKGGSNHDYFFTYEGNSRFTYNLQHGNIHTSTLDVNPENAKDVSRLNSLFDQIQQNRDKEKYMQLDLSWQETPFFLSSISAGIKYRKHEITQDTYRGVYTGDNSLIPIEDIVAASSPTLHRHSNTAETLSRYATVDRELALSIIESEKIQSKILYQPNPDAYFNLTENISSIYTNGEFEYSIIHTDAGIRVVHTSQESSAYNADALSNYQKNYIDILPSTNSKIYIHDNIYLRVALAKTMARPAYADLIPKSIRFEGDDTIVVREGNPELKPFRANQGDFSIEWYRNDTSLYAVSFFYKDISTYIYTQSKDEYINGMTTSTSKPQNSHPLTLKGIEAQLNQDVIQNFGFSLNYTHTDAEKIRTPNNQSFFLPGNSKDQINISLYYEDEKISSRLSCNYRSKSFLEPSSNLQDQAESHIQLDYKFSWKPTKKVHFYMDAINLTNELVKINTTSNLPKGIYDNGRRFLIGTKINF